MILFLKTLSKMVKLGSNTFAEEIALVPASKWKGSARWYKNQ